jgi:hypothetical protein
VSERPARQNQLMCALRLCRQFGQSHGARRHASGIDCAARESRTGQCENQPRLVQSLPPQWPTGERHGKSLKSEAAMLPNRARNLKPLPQIGATESRCLGALAINVKPGIVKSCC